MSQLKGQFLGLKAVCHACGHKEDMEDLTEEDIGTQCPDCGEVMISKDDVASLAEIKEKVMKMVGQLQPGDYPMGCKDDDDGNLVVPAHVSALLLDHKTGEHVLASRLDRSDDDNEHLEVMKAVQCMWDLDPNFPEKILYMHDQMHKEMEGEEDRRH